MAEKKGVGGWMKNLLFEDVSTESSGKPSSPATSKPSGAPVFRSSTASPTSPRFMRPLGSAQAPSGGVNDEMFAEIEDALEDRSSLAYKKFSEVLSSLAVKLPDEVTRFAAALAVAPTLNLDPDAIREAFSERLSILDSLQSEFEEATQHELDRRVNGAKSEVEKIDGDINGLSREIDRLNSQLEDLKKLRAQKSAAIESDNESLMSVRKKMKSAFEAVRAKATTERDTVSRHTQGS